MICIQNVCGKAILMCLNSNFGRDFIYSKTHFKGLAPFYKVKDVLIHIRFNIVHPCHQCNRTDPDEMLHYAVSHPILRSL